MRHLINIGLLLLLLTACSNGGQVNSTTTPETTNLTNDTVIGSKTITNEIAGSAYRRRAIGYFVIIGKDTSDYTCIFTESKDGGKVGIDLNIPYSKAAMTYRQRLEELKIVLPKAATDFDFDSLTGISFGRLVLSGDLAVDVTKQYRQKFGTSNKLRDYETVGQFLAKSKLGADIDSLFKPYSISVDKVYIEKLFFATKEELYWASKIEIDSANVPDKILDCMTGVKLTKK
jgi:hypothetical protein